MTEFERMEKGLLYDCNDQDILKVQLPFVEKHWEELLKFSRRTPRQLERWASRYGYKECPKDILDHAKKGSLGRYTAVNVSNEHTIEFRMFRGTLKLNIIKTVATADKMAVIARYRTCFLPNFIFNFPFPIRTVTVGTGFSPARPSF